MKLRHEILLSFADRGSATLGELVQQFGRRITPEEAVRRYKDGSRFNWTPEEKLYRGRRSTISNIMSEMADEDKFTTEYHADGTDNHRYSITDKGRESIDRYLKRRVSSDGLLEARKVLLEEVRRLTSEKEWVPQSELFAVARECVSDEEALEHRKNTPRVERNSTLPMTADEGRRLLFMEALTRIRYDRKTDEDGRVFFRARNPVKDKRASKRANFLVFKVNGDGISSGEGQVPAGEVVTGIYDFQGWSSLEELRQAVRKWTDKAKPGDVFKTRSSLIVTAGK